MRTAEEWLNLLVDSSDGDLLVTTEGNDLFEGHASTIFKAINAARKEAIEECAERAEAEMDYETFPDGTPIGGEENSYPIVNKESILSLINELK